MGYATESFKKYPEVGSVISNLLSSDKINTIFWVFHFVHDEGTLLRLIQS